jgi:hypothetical protein
MSILSWFETASGVTEAFVLGLITKIETGIQVAIADIEQAWNWIAAHAGEISSDAAVAANGLQTLKAAGIPIPAAATTAIADMNVAVTALNAAVAASNAGANAAGVLAAGYVAAKQAQAATATVNAAVASAVPAPPVAATSTQSSSG